MEPSTGSLSGMSPSTWVLVVDSMQDFLRAGAMDLPDAPRELRAVWLPRSGVAATAASRQPCGTRPSGRVYGQRLDRFFSSLTETLGPAPCLSTARAVPPRGS